MRVRMIRPAYWTDADLHTRLSADCREFYIGLWMESDDAGFVDWEPDRIGADLYPFRALSWRRRMLNRWLAELSVNGHIQLLECGRHLLVTNLTKYQSPPKPSYQNRKAHDACLRHVAPAGTSTGREGVGKEGKGFIKGGAAAPESQSDDGAPSEFRRKVAAAASA